ncbi:MAG: GSCFA domain-containing protein [Bermanella sp.]
MKNEKDPFYDSFLTENNKNIEFQYEEADKYQQLNEISKNNSNIVDLECEQMGNGRHTAYYQSLDETGIKNIDEVISRNPELVFDDEVVSLIDSIISDDIDRELKAYLGSNYAIMFYGRRDVTDKSRDENPSICWHCDAAPLNSAMLICYLNGDEEHNSSTLFMDETNTKALKKVGYVYCRVRDRRENIDELLNYYDLENNEKRHSFKAGESVIFGAASIIHRAQVPSAGTTRRSFDLCIIPSPIPWKEAIRKGYTPYNKDVPYSGQVQRLLTATSVTLSEEKDTVQEATDIGAVIQIPSSGGVTSKESLKFHLNSIFSDKKYAKNIYERIIHMGVNLNTLTINELIGLLKNSYKQGLKWDELFSEIDLINLSDVVDYEKKYRTSILNFTLEGKPNPRAVMWPIPDHPKHPSCKFDMVPYVNTHKIMNKQTPIGSAGSCFAVEISEVLQEEKFNYVITELGDLPEKEAYIDGYEVGSGKAMYSANFGILFNTPSLKQIAEKAFAEKEFTKYLFQGENGLYSDPYRENVFFANKENYLRDYPKHVEAIKQVLLQSEVFIFTAGLNECWQLFDGSVISRNPKNGFYHLIEHRVLTVQENVDNIMAFFNLVKRHNPKFKLILTLSPVPLLATGRGATHHILEANTHSKAVLKVALEEVVKQHPDIYYLPSYELVTECMPNPWKPDHRHVTAETVSKVIAMFKEIFVEGE